MITITTINNSWYFINDNFRIRPNETEVYDETTLTYRQVRDLLNAEVNNRVTLSAPDKLVLEQKLELLDGNLDVSELKTINGSSLAGPGNIAITVNSTDAQLRDRATHTGTQLAATVSDFAPSVRSTALTGLSTATATPVLPADALVVAVGKLQAQVAAQRLLAKVPKSATRFYSNAKYGTPFSVSVVAALQRRTAFFEPQFDFTIDQIGLVVTVAPPITAKIWLAVYETDAATPSQLNLLHTFSEIAVDTTEGAKMTSASYTFKQGRTYVFVHHSDTALNIRNISVYAGLSIGLTSADATAPSTFFFENGMPYAAPPATINTTVMTMAPSNPTLIVMRAT